MTFEGFIRYMLSEDCSLFKQEHKAIYQDMSHPMCDYFINSSHNTYLIQDQLIGPSHLWGYAKYVHIFDEGGNCAKGFFHMSSCYILRRNVFRS